MSENPLDFPIPVTVCFSSFDFLKTPVDYGSHVKLVNILTPNVLDTIFQLTFNPMWITSLPESS